MVLLTNKKTNKQQLIRNKRRYLCSYSMSVCMISYFCYKLTLFLYDIPWMTSNYENLYNRRIMMDDSKRLMKNKQQPWKWTDWTTIIQDIAIRFRTSYPSRDLGSLPGFYLIIILLFIQVAFCVVCLFVVVVLCLVPNDARFSGLCILDWPSVFSCYYILCDQHDISSATFISLFTWAYNGFIYWLLHMEWCQDILFLKLFLTSVVLWHIKVSKCCNLSSTNLWYCRI